MKVGVVGYGSIGTRHANNLRGLGHKVVIYDPKLSRGDRDFNLERDLYDSDVEAVVIATPSVAHEGPLRACIERGKHVLIEKPISVAEGALDELLLVAAEKSLVVMMGNNLRFHPCVTLAQQWLMAGQIGKPIWAQFTCAQLNTRHYTDPVLLNWGAHEVDLAAHLFGPVVNVLCADVDDEIADFTLRHESGVRSSFHLDYLTTVEIRECWLAGEDHNIGIDFVNRRVSLGKHVQGMGGTYDDDYVAEMQAFLDRIGGKITLGATGRDGLETLEILKWVGEKGSVE